MKSNDNKESEWLYHYTNIESLAQILANRTIRFNSLDRVDDLQEKQTADICNIGQFCYVSSWTDDEKESIPMWKMYGSLEAGVRIKLRKYPFFEYECTPDSLQSLGMPIIDETKAGQYPSSTIPYVELINKGFCVYPLSQYEMLYKIVYTDDSKQLIPSLVTRNMDTINIATGLLGKYKNTYWSFQKEWRYKFVVYPFDVKKYLLDENYLARENLKLLSGGLKRPFDYYDLTIKEEAFSEMEIVMGPRISNGNETIVRSLVGALNPKAKLRSSSLVGKI